MWGFFYFTICNYMLYWKLNLIKFGRVDIGELFWDSNNQPLRGNAEFWSNYQIGKNQLLDFLKDYKDYEVCCYENVEGTDMRITNPELYQFFIDYYKETGKKIILKTNALNIDYDDNVIHYPCFGFMGALENYKIEPRKFKNKILFLNRVERWHRTFLHDEFKKRNLLQYFDYSINSEDSNLVPFKSIEKVQIDIPKIMDILPNYFTCFVNLLTETHFFNGDERDNVLFITEKLDKIIAAGQPFIIVSVPNYIKTLKKLGFKTFDKWWDESYDNILNEPERLECIIKIVEDICKLSISELENMYIEMIPVLEHNQKLTKFIGNLSTDWNDYTLDDVIDAVKNDFEEYIYNME